MYNFCYEKVIIPTVKVHYIPTEIIADVDGLLKARGVLLRYMKAIQLIRYVEDAYEEFTDFKKIITRPGIDTDIKFE